MLETMMPSNNNRYLFLPVETKAREFNAKVLFSCFAAKEGFGVYLGELNELMENLQNLPVGIYIDKSIAPTKVKSFTKIKNLGNRIVAWCEEGLVYRDRDAYLRERISPKSFSMVDFFFAWGNVQTGDIKLKLTEDNHKVTLVGNPRFDVLRHPFRFIFDEEARALRDKYGSFILINTNFSRFNHFKNRMYVLETLKKRGTIKTREEEEFFLEGSNYLGRIFRGFKDMLVKLSKAFPDYLIILRPHPSENHEAWKNIAENLANVEVIYEGSVIPWIISSDVVIHNSCTTGLEAFLLDKPVIAYSPESSEVFDSVLPNSVSINVSTSEELISTIAALQKEPEKGGKAITRDNVEFAHEYITALDGLYASERILSVLRDMSSLSEKSNGKKRNSIGFLISQIRNDHRSFVKSVLKGLGIDISRGREYKKQKFPGLTLEEVEDAIGTLAGISEEFYGIRAERLKGTDSCYLIKKV